MLRKANGKKVTNMQLYNFLSLPFPQTLFFPWQSFRKTTKAHFFIPAFSAFWDYSNFCIFYTANNLQQLNYIEWRLWPWITAIDYCCLSLRHDGDIQHLALLCWNTRSNSDSGDTEWVNRWNVTRTSILILNCSYTLPRVGRLNEDVPQAAVWITSFTC